MSLLTTNLVVYRNNKGNTIWVFTTEDYNQHEGTPTINGKSIPNIDLEGYWYNDYYRLSYLWEGTKETLCGMRDRVDRVYVTPGFALMAREEWKKLRRVWPELPEIVSDAIMLMQGEE